MVLRDGDASSQGMRVSELGRRVGVGLCLGLGQGRDGTGRDGCQDPAPRISTREGQHQDRIPELDTEELGNKTQDADAWTYTRGSLDELGHPPAEGAMAPCLGALDSGRGGAEFH